MQRVVRGFIGLGFAVLLSAGAADAQDIAGTARPDSAYSSRDSTRVEDVHPQDSPSDRGFTIEIPGQRATLRIFGSMRLNGGYDRNGLQGSETFDTYAIPVGKANRSDSRYFMDVNQTRFGIESNSKSQMGDILMRIEGDFRSSSGTLRLVHAFGTVRHVLAGLTWSTFGDPNSIPQTVDPTGPNSSVGERAIQIRYSNDFSPSLKWSLAAETNTPELTEPDTLVTEPAFQSVPNLAGRLKKYGAWGHVQFAAVSRGFTVKTAGNRSQHLLGYGGLLSSSLVLNPDDELLTQIVAGHAISRYTALLSGNGQDAIYNTQTNEFETVPLVGIQLAYGHRWQKDLKSFVSLGLVRIPGQGAQPPTGLEMSQYFSANLLWSPSRSLRTGVEQLWGRRVDWNGIDGSANRIAFCLYYDF